MGKGVGFPGRKVGSDEGYTVGVLDGELDGAEVVLPGR